MKDKRTDIVLVVLTWLGMAGSYFDGWIHLQPTYQEELNTLIGFIGNPGHAIMYSTTVSVIVYLMYQLHYSPVASIDISENGYVLSLIGGLIVLAAGFADLLWHITFGVEKIGLSSQLSPPHAVMVFAGSVLIGFGVLIQKWYKQDTALTSFDKSITVLMATFIVGMMRYLMQTFSPVGNFSLTPSVDLVLSLAIQNGLTIWMLLIILKKQRIQEGMMFMFLFISQIGTVIIFEEYVWILYILIGSVAGEFIHLTLPSSLNTRQLRVFAFLIPIVFTLSYFLTFWYVAGSLWPIHVWTGTVIMNGYIGLLLSYLAVEPYRGING